MYLYKLALTILFIISFGVSAEEQTNPPQNQGVIRIATGEWPPYISKNLKHFGVVSHVISQAFAKKELK
ncbi:hypothetical protein [Spartinivicinus ruber]|uniref:hypothetical protein n=1 Tax=Spartinivicinus ruber TaxID=2683272 RepID=UPI0013D4F925|nr:hypothetical protein [Spartinivicinus ruber]